MFTKASSVLSLLLLTLPSSSSQAIDPDSVDIGTREQWCEAQITQCPLLCLQLPNEPDTESNSCDAETLNYSCICSSGQSPNATEFSQTIPYFLCTERNNACVRSCASGDNACAGACRDDNPCGAQEPTELDTATLTMASSTATGEEMAAASTDADGNVLFDGLVGEDFDGAESGAVVVWGFERLRAVEVGVLVLGVFAGFGVLL